jgi:hypothetical protein
VTRNAWIALGLVAVTLTVVGLWVASQNDDVSTVAGRSTLGGEGEPAFGEPSAAAEELSLATTVVSGGTRLPMVGNSVAGEAA